MIIYSKQGCPPCITIKAFLNRLGATYEERDIANPEYLAEASQYAMSVPVVVKDDQVVVGADLSRIKALI